MQLRPTTKPGRIATKLVAACAAVFVIAVVVSVVVGDKRFDNSAFDFYRMIVGTTFLVTGAGGLVAGLIAVIRERERGLLAIIAVALGLLAVAFALGDVFFP